MVDKYQGSEGIDSPSDDLREITPHDTNELADMPKGIFVGTGGDLVVLGKDNATEVTLKVASGSYHPIRVKKVFATGTTASDIVGLF